MTENQAAIALSMYESVAAGAVDGKFVKPVFNSTLVIDASKPAISYQWNGRPVEKRTVVQVIRTYVPTNR